MYIVRTPVCKRVFVCARCNYNVQKERSLQPALTFQVNATSLDKAFRLGNTKSSYNKSRDAELSEISLLIMTRNCRNLSWNPNLGHGPQSLLAFNSTLKL